MTRFAAPERAWLRALPDSYPRCVRTTSEPIDVALARAQHAAYADALADAGVSVVVLETDERCPDAVFIEDTAVLLGPEALITVPGAPSRRAEVPPVAEALERSLALRRLSPPATLDGGDVLRVGDRLIVGLSERTSPAGALGLREVASPWGLTVDALPVAAGLHLKSALTLAAPDLLVAVRGAFDLGPLGAWGLQVLEVDEPMGGNVLALGPRVLVSASAPETAALLRGQGLDVRVLNVSELHKGDGALTCLSLRQPPPGCWCA